MRYSLLRGQSKRWNVRALCYIAFFLVGIGLTYLTRYLTAGLNSVGLSDVIFVLAIPVVLLILAALAGFLIVVLHRIQCSKIFKTLHATLAEFLKKGQELCESITKYINDYLTVYFNYHLKYSKLEKMTEQIFVLENDIKDLEEKARPIDDLASKVCKLTTEDLKVPQTPDSDENMAKTFEDLIVGRIRNSDDTDFSRSESAHETTSPWIEKVTYAIGNINS